MFGAFFLSANTFFAIRTRTIRTFTFFTQRLVTTLVDFSFLQFGLDFTRTANKTNPDKEKTQAGKVTHKTPQSIEKEDCRYYTTNFKENKFVSDFLRTKRKKPNKKREEQSKANVFYT